MTSRIEHEGAVLFEVLQTVTFTERGEQTELTVEHRVTRNEGFPGAAGAEIGWERDARQAGPSTSTSFTAGAPDEHASGRARHHAVVYRTIDAGSLEGRRKLIARELGRRAVKLNRFDSQPDQAGSAHDEVESGQEEIYIPVAGSGRIVIGSDEIELEPGRFVLVSPEETRQVIAGPAGLSYVVVGAVVG